MAYFECTIGGGANANIIVTYNATLYGKTITCSNGIDTYTQTTTSSGVTEFEVDTEGTWTITCDGISKTVDVVFNYDVAMSITKTITVYSAANDTLSFTDSSGSKTVTTDSTGEGSVSITFESGNTVTFTSTVAKNPNDMTANYSKAITLTDSTTEIFVMPDGLVLYWWGYEPNTLNKFDYYSTSFPSSGVTVTRNTNNIRVVTGVSARCALEPNTKIEAQEIASHTKMIAITNVINGYIGPEIWLKNYGGVGVSPSTYTSPNTLVSGTGSSSDDNGFRISHSNYSYSGNDGGYPSIGFASSTTYVLYAAYYE